MSTEDKINYRYKFILGNGVEREFNIQLDGLTLNLIKTDKIFVYPTWTELKNFKCPNCTLDEKTSKYCPIAVNIIELVDFFKESISYEEADVIVNSDAREYRKHTTLQKGVSALIGIYMVTSGCPVMEKLKPMVRYHLPFATMEETSYRVISMYLLAQYFLYKRGKEVDLELKKLARIYDDVQVVNRNICAKLRELEIEDAILNALINLDCFASSVSLASYEEMLKKIEYVFKVFF